MRKFDGRELVVATHNTGKLEEIAHMLQDYRVGILGASEKGVDEPDETETTFVGNARIKAHAASRVTGLPSLSDDSGLEVDALGYSLKIGSIAEAVKSNGW